MDQIKIGRFIKEKRKEVNLTQSELAEKLNVTDRAISKWENGNCMPYSGIIKELCNILNITINDLFSGEVVDMKKYDETLEENLLEMIKQKEEKDKMLLRMEIIAGILGILPLIPATILVNYLDFTEFQEVLIIFASMIPLLISLPFLIIIEQKAGYYKCGKCGHRYIPEFKSVFFAMHSGRTRYLKCPKCPKKSWNKKVINKEEN